MGVGLWALYYVIIIFETLGENYRQTQCNQGLLTLELYDEWIESRLAQCSDVIINRLREKY